MKLAFFPLLFFVMPLQADVNAGVEALTKACRLGDLKMAETLLSSGVNPDLADRYGHTPLYYAAAFNEAKAVELLLAYHADPRGRTNSRRELRQTPETPLQYAASLGNLRITEMLIRAGASINTKTAGGSTALHFAIGQLVVMQFLINAGADLNARDAEGISPLDDAVWNGSLDAAAILLAHGARLNEREPKTGATPINEAAYRGNTPIVRYLLDFNPDLAIPDNRGNTPLENAIRKKKEDSALLLLDAQTKEQRTTQFLGRAMDAAVKSDESILVNALLRHGVPINGTLPSGSTALDAAAFAGAIKTVRLLLENNADPNIRGRSGTTPLEDASLKGFDTIAGVLLDHGARVNDLNDDSGTTALYAAASFGKGEVVKLLLQRGANPNLCGKNRKSPYQAALENSYLEVATQIKSHGGATGCEQ